MLLLRELSDASVSTPVVPRMVPLRVPPRDRVIQPVVAALSRRRFVSVGALALAGAGCSSGGGVVSAIMGPRATRLKVEILASKDLNPDLRRRASPAVVRLYELKDATAFGAADFMSLYQRDQADLAGDILVREEFTLQPGERRVVERSANAAARWLGVFVAYRDIDRALWRASARLEVGKLNEWRIDVGANAVAMPSGDRR